VGRGDPQARAGPGLNAHGGRLDGVAPRLLFGVDDNREICRSICSTSAFAALIIDRPSVIQPRATPTAHHRGRLLRSIRGLARVHRLRCGSDADRVPPRNPRDGCWRLLAGSGCRVGCRASRPSCVGREPGSSAHIAGIIDGHVAGFTDLDDHGYIDMLFVDPDFGRHGVASALLASVVALARQRGTVALTTYASLTAKPLFERHGFVVTEERHFLSPHFEGCASRHTPPRRSQIRPSRLPAVQGVPRKRVALRHGVRGGLWALAAGMTCRRWVFAAPPRVWLSSAVAVRRRWSGRAAGSVRSRCRRRPGLSRPSPAGRGRR
jgi:GNAT superfamily N-acetyltransferase